MGCLGHPLAFQQIAMNKDAMETTAGSVTILQKALLV